MSKRGFDFCIDIFTNDVGIMSVSATGIWLG
jgi:hypothetical protein